MSSLAPVKHTIETGVYWGFPPDHQWLTAVSSRLSASSRFAELALDPLHRFVPTGHLAVELALLHGVEDLAKARPRPPVEIEQLATA
jgi:hypothetical protein